jgi:hypothetical protein
LINEEEEILRKYGFKQAVELEVTLPTEEKEFIMDYEMKFVDRHYQAKQQAENLGEDPYGGDSNADKPESLSQANGDYECNLSDVIVSLKKCGYPLENCFVSYFSPVFSAFINCGLDPLPQSIKLSKEDLIAVKPGSSGAESYRLHLKFLWGIRSEFKGEEEGAAGSQVPELEQHESTSISGR